MRFPSPLIEGRLIRRYKRFLADVVLDDGREVTVHVPNSGAMLGLNAPGAPVWLSVSDNPKRKLAHTLELMEADGGLVGINTMHPNRVAAEGIAAGMIPELNGYARLRREVRYGRNSRIDILLEDDLTGTGRPDAHVEIKNVHLRRPERGDGMTAEFPDCVTARGTKHLDEMADVVSAGGRAVLLFIVQRMDCVRVSTAPDLDPAYDRALRRAMSLGVEVTCRACVLTPEGIELGIPLPFRAAE